MTFTVEREFTGGANPLDKLFKLAIAAAREEMRLEREAADTVHKHKGLCADHVCAQHDAENT